MHAYFLHVYILIIGVRPLYLGISACMSHAGAAEGVVGQSQLTTGTSI